MQRYCFFDKQFIYHQIFISANVRRLYLTKLVSLYSFRISFALFSSFAWQNDNEVLSFYVGSPSMHFKLLRQANFEILDFTESKCVEEAKTIDMNYYIKNSEIPQFMAFLAKK